MSLQIRPHKKDLAILIKPRKKARRRTRGAMSAGMPSSMAGRITRDYAMTLLNPFEYGPLRLGYDCMADTNLSTLYVRGSLQAGSDGSFWIALPPDALGLFTSSQPFFNGGGVGRYAYGNTDSVRTQMNTARVVSGGIRVLPLFASTATPGVLVAGYAPETNYTVLNQQSAATLFNASTSRLGVGANGAASVILPLDNESFAFKRSVMDGPTATTEFYHSTTPFVAGTGFPASTTIWFEGVLNLEGPLLVLSPGGYSGTSSASASQTSAADFFPTAQTLFNKVKDVVKDPVAMEFAGDAASLIHPVLGNMVKAASHFGRSRATHIRSAVQTVSRPLIEEVKAAEVVDVGRDEL